MNANDLITILGNFSQSLYPVQRLLTAFSYLLGLMFFYIAVSKIKKIADHRAQSSSHEKMYIPMMYLLMGAFLLYSPTAIDTMANTAFGTGNVLSYIPTNRFNIQGAMGLIIRTAGLLWFIRGCVLVTQSGQSNAKKIGHKGLLFIMAGILAMNFDNTVSMLNNMMAYIGNLTITIKNSQGY